MHKRSDAERLRACVVYKTILNVAGCLMERDAATLRDHAAAMERVGTIRCAALDVQSSAALEALLCLRGPLGEPEPEPLRDLQLDAVRLPAERADDAVLLSARGMRVTPCPAALVSTVLAAVRPGLTNLTLSGCGLTDECLFLVAEAVRRGALRDLTSLGLYQGREERERAERGGATTFTGAGLEAVFRALGHATTPRLCEVGIVGRGVADAVYPAVLAFIHNTFVSVTVRDRDPHYGPRIFTQPIYDRALARNGRRAVARDEAARRVLAMMTPTVVAAAHAPAAAAPVVAFLHRDGDNAIMTRVFLRLVQMLDEHRLSGAEAFDAELQADWSPEESGGDGDGESDGDDE